MGCSLNDYPVVTTTLLLQVDVIPKVIEFLQEQGRMKFVRPLYRALLQASLKHAAHSSEFYDAAVDTFSASEKSYHPIAAKMIARDIALHNETHRKLPAASNM